VTRLVVAVLVAAAFPATAAAHGRSAPVATSPRAELTHGVALKDVGTAAPKVLVTTALGAGIGAAVVGVRLMAREEVPT